MATNNPLLNGGGINSSSSSSTNIKVNNIKSNAFGNISVPLSSCHILISSIANNQQLVYDSTLSRWKNKTVSMTTTLSALTDTNINTPLNSQSLLYDTSTSKWKKSKLF